LKARQLGISWLVAAYGLWKVLFAENAKVLFMSKGEDEAWQLIDKSRFILNHLPDYLGLIQKHPENKTIIDFKASNSVIQALPSTKDAGKGTDATLVVRDELASHPYAGENFSAIGPAIDSGGQLIDLSTINKLDVESHFTERVNRARDKTSNAHLIFLGWKLRPVRQEGLSLDEWFKLRILPKYSPLEIEQEYPETIEEALKLSGVRAFFDINALEDMLMYVHPTVPAEINTHNGMVKIYQLPVVGEQYCIFTDPSDGKDDPHATGVMHPRTGEIVALSHGKIPADECAQIHDSLVRFYNNAFNTFEINAMAGGKMAETIKKLETPRCFGFRKGELKSGEEGWWTGGWSGTSVRRDMIYRLEEAIRKRLIILHDREAIEELRGFIVPEGGIPQASRGLHDDYIMMLGGLWMMRKVIPQGSGSGYSFKYKQSW